MMILTFLKSAHQDGEFEYCRRSVPCLEQKMSGIPKKIFSKILRIFKVIRAFEGGIVQTSKSTQILRLEEQIPNM